MPSPGKITYLRVPGGPGIRDDSGVYTGWVVPQFYDPLLSKLVAWAPTREQAIERLIRALGEYTVHGITTNVAYLAAVLDHPAFRSGEYDTGFCARYERDLLRARPGLRGRGAHRRGGRGVQARSRRGRGVRRPRRSGGGVPLGLGAARARPRPARRWPVSAYVALLDGGKREETLEVRQTAPGIFEVKLRGMVHVVDAFKHDYGTLAHRGHRELHRHARSSRRARARPGEDLGVSDRDPGREEAPHAPGDQAVHVEERQTLTAPMPGRIVQVLANAGDQVREGQGLVVVEAMKMENEMKSPKDGKVVEVLVSEGQAVEGNAKLCVVE